MARLVDYNSKIGSDSPLEMGTATETCFDGALPSRPLQATSRRGGVDVLRKERN
jgi:hypothetical protein